MGYSVQDIPPYEIYGEQKTPNPGNCHHIQFSPGKFPPIEQFPRRLFPVKQFLTYKSCPRGVVLHTEKSFRNLIKSNQIDLEPNGRPFGLKSIGK